MFDASSVEELEEVKVSIPVMRTAVIMRICYNPLWIQFVESV